MELRTPLTKVFRCKYHITFKDNSEDYISEDDIDMIDVIYIQLNPVKSYPQGGWEIGPS